MAGDPNLAHPDAVIGWLVAQGTTVAHHFENGRSRCGRWLLTTLDTPETHDNLRCAPCVEGVATDRREAALFAPKEPSE